MAAGQTVVRLDAEQVLKNLRRIADRYPKAVARAVNRATVTAKAELARTVAKDMGLKVSRVKDRLPATQATARDPRSRIRAAVYRIPLIEFRSSGKPFPSRGRGRGVRAMGKTYPGLFIAEVGKSSDKRRKKHKGIFGRDKPSVSRSPRGWSKNLPIAERKGPSIWQSAHRHRDSAQAKGLEALKKNVIHELRFVLSQET